MENVDWGGHWRVIIGFDTMGDDQDANDVLILADPYDTTDHRQDGYGIVPAQRFYYMWFDAQLFRKGEQRRQWVTAVPPDYQAEKKGKPLGNKIRRPHGPNTDSPMTQTPGCASASLHLPDWRHGAFVFQYGF